MTDFRVFRREGNAIKFGVTISQILALRDYAMHIKDVVTTNDKIFWCMKIDKILKQIIEHQTLEMRDSYYDGDGQ